MTLRQALKSTAFISRARCWWPFILLLIVAASRWVVADTHPEAAPSLASATLGCGWAALLLFSFLPRNPASTLQPSVSQTLNTLLAGGLFLGGPAIGLILSTHGLSAGALTMALALTPVVVAISTSAFGSAGREGVAGRIWPGLAAVTGLLLILVQPNLSDTRNDIALFFAPTLTGLGAALFEREQLSRAATAVALIGASALFAFATACYFFTTTRRPSVSLLAIAYEGILAILSVLALSRLGATRWSSQFTWLPLLILMEGILLVRPPLTARWLTGLGLLSVASIYLLLPQADEPDFSPTLIG